MPGKGERMHQIATNLTICSRESKAIAISMYSSFMVLSLVGNSLLITVFYRNKSLRTPVHCFIMNMTLSDLIIPIISLPTAIIRLTYMTVPYSARLSRFLVVSPASFPCRVWWPLLLTGFMLSYSQ